MPFGACPATAALGVAGPAGQSQADRGFKSHPMGRALTHRTDLIEANQVMVYAAKPEHGIKATFDGDQPKIVDVGIPDENNVNDPKLTAEPKNTLTPNLGPPIP